MKHKSLILKLIYDTFLYVKLVLIFISSWNMYIKSDLPINKANVFELYLKIMRGFTV